jgi:Flp pilus assembly protein TadD
MVQNMRQNMRKSITSFSLVVLLGVAACTHKTTDLPIVGDALNSAEGMHDQTQTRLTTAAQNAIAEGKTKEALAYYSKLYADKRTPEVTLNYAQLLRKTGKAEQAAQVLSPAVNGRDGELRGNARPIMLNEYAAANIELGKYDLAEEALNKVLEDKNAARFHADADNLLGLVLDAKNKHKEAEQYYRLALDGWQGENKGDNTAVMNNLGLCLAAQGMFDESLTTLRRALIKSPHNTEVAANIKMVSDLRKAVLPTAPISVTRSGNH